MLRLGLAALVSSLVLLAEGFTFTIGNPVASQDFQMKSAAFVFRTEGCADPSKAQIDATAEGMLKGARKSVTLRVVTGAKPGIYAVFQQWPLEGQWVVN